MLEVWGMRWPFSRSFGGRRRAPFGEVWDNVKGLGTVVPSPFFAVGCLPVWVMAVAPCR